MMVAASATSSSPAQALMIERHQRVMSFVGGAADGVPSDNHTISEIDCTENGCMHADVRFRAGDNQVVSFYCLQVFRKAEAPRNAEYRVLL